MKFHAQSINFHFGRSPTNAKNAPFGPYTFLKKVILGNIYGPNGACFTLNYFRPK